MRGDAAVAGSSGPPAAVLTACDRARQRKAAVSAAGSEPDGSAGVLIPGSLIDVAMPGPPQGGAKDHHDEEEEEGSRDQGRGSSSPDCDAGMSGTSNPGATGKKATGGDAALRLRRVVGPANALPDGNFSTGAQAALLASRDHLLVMTAVNEARAAFGLIARE